MTGSEHTSDAPAAPSAPAGLDEWAPAGQPPAARAGERAPAQRTGLPYRGRYGDRRPAELARLPLPPARMPLLHARRPLKRWRYVGFFSPELIACVAIARIGPARDAFWAVWDRRRQAFHRGGGPLHRGVELADGLARIRSRRLSLELAFTEGAGIETVAAAGAAHAWTRKQGTASARAWLSTAAGSECLAGTVLVDDTAAYYARHTQWRWSAGAGRGADGRHVAWSLVEGVNDSPRDSERTIWIDGVASEAPPSRFAADLSAVEELTFEAEATLERRTSLGLVRSRYRQPMGTFRGRLPGGVELAEAYGVMEHHDAWW